MGDVSKLVPTLRPSPDQDAARALLSIFRKPASHGRRPGSRTRLAVNREVRQLFVEAQRMGQWGR